MLIERKVYGVHYHSASIIDRCRYLGNIILSILTCLVQLFQRFQVRMNEAFVKSANCLLSLFSESELNYFIHKTSVFHSLELVIFFWEEAQDSINCTHQLIQTKCLACFPLIKRR